MISRVWVSSAGDLVTPLCSALSLPSFLLRPHVPEIQTLPRYGYCHPNNGQHCSEPEASAACQTDLHVSSLRICTASRPDRAHFCSPLRVSSLCFSPGCCLLKRELRLSALLNQQICRTLESKLHDQHPKVNVPKKPPLQRLRLSWSWHLSLGHMPNDIFPASKINI